MDDPTSPSHDSAGGPPPALVITGMHRSATSLATATLASAGLAIGERLIEAGRGNLDGHFEDRDFVALHERILRGNGLGGEGYATDATINLPAALADEAGGLVDERRRAGIAWGWKDPRTTLFLDFWLERVPEARFLLLVRRPWEVVDSLYRRGDEPFRLHPAFAIDVWTAYNRRIRDFFLAHRDRCLLVDAARAVADGAGLVAVVRERLGIPLGEATVVAKPERFRRDDGSLRRHVLAAARPEAIDLCIELLDMAWRFDEPAACRADPAIAVEAAMAEWARAARVESDRAGFEATVSRLERELAETRQALDTARTEVAAAMPVGPQLFAPTAVARDRGTPRLAGRFARELRRICRQARAVWHGLDPRRSPAAPPERPDSAEAA
jgi:hypothetical protein